MMRSHWAWCALVLCASFLPRSGDAAPPGPVRIALFDDPAFVDTSGGFTAESDNVQAALTSLGFTFTTFVGTTAVSWETATRAADVVIIPDLEIATGDLQSSLNENAEQAIVDFVAAGGVLVVMGNTNGRQSGLLNAAFGFATSTNTGGPTQLSDQGSPDSRWVQGPFDLPANNLTVSWIAPVLDTAFVYQDPLAHVATVVAIPYGAGKIVCMGWDFFNAAPVG